MPRQGLSKEKVVQAAIKYMEETGNRDFTLKELAAYLSIKSAAFYKHITNLAELNYEIEKVAIKKLSEAMEEASIEKRGKDALIALADTYRNYAKTNPILYQILLTSPAANEKLLKDTKRSIGGIYRQILQYYLLSDEETFHLARMLRSAIHGFITFEHADYFQAEVSTDDSFHYMIEHLMDLLPKKTIDSKGGLESESTSD
ncbi:TetR-like C-terminal domain-containing protein [Clostridium sp. MB40-C1]|uniref:TetR/AcrR family transcriptional regulator n=1 Tax=Clostridium sp. MB40-C1 TaxID=3070996 RepID=UPI0027DF2A91|nr:TetR-like C-terminal domain-containing protein [Clostridium sp. MB40-C1]WMJ81523.1 TetR-like C-terminal domain-containing protein [Clostridium sp. MB40-C1]